MTLECVTTALEGMIVGGALWVASLGRPRNRPMRNLHREGEQTEVAREGVVSDVIEEW